MLTSAKNCAENNNNKKKEPDRQNPRTNGKSKAIQTKSHKEASYTLRKREKGKSIYISLLPKSTASILG